MLYKNAADHAEDPAAPKRFKMKFELIINMPVRGKTDAPPAMIHRMVVEHWANDLKDFTDQISKWPFIIVEEFFPGPSGSWKSAVSNGAITVNTDLIGKVREWN